jgi:hypothetical protein
VKLLLVGLFALLPCEAGGSAPPKPTGDDVTARIRSMMPPGWTAETRGLARDVVVLFRGPAQKLGRATVTVARLPTREPSANDAVAVEAAFAESGMSVAYEAQGPFGGPALETFRDGQWVRQWVVPGPVSYLVTVAAPKALIERTTMEVLKAAETFRQAAPKKTAALDTKPTNRPDEARLGAEPGQAD